MRPQTTTRRLQRKLDAEKLLAIGKEMADKLTEVEQIEIAKKRITPLRDELTLLGSKYNSGFEDVEIECEIHYNTPEPGKKSIIHPDSGETIEVMDMNKEDLQEDLQFSDAEVVGEGTKSLPAHNDLAIPPWERDNAA
jgi:hypothetical protein